jgi:hypothetical protein
MPEPTWKFHEADTKLSSSTTVSYLISLFDG